MPSLGEMRIVSGVGVTVGNEVAIGVGIIVSLCGGTVTEDVNDVSVTGGVSVPHAARKSTNSGIIFFIILKTNTPIAWIFPRELRIPH